MEISYIISSLLSGAAATLVAWVVFVRFVLPTRNRREMAKALLRMQEAYQTMDHVLDTTRAKRFMILKTENGGGKPHPGSRLYASVVREAQRPPFVPGKDDYQRLMVDAHYIDTLAEVFQHGKILFNVREMPEGLLRRIYVKEGVTWALIFYLHGNSQAFYYGSIATDEAEGMMSNNELLAHDIAINKLRNIYKNITD